MLRKTEPIKLGFSQPKLIGFYPNERALKKMSNEKLLELFITQIDYYNGGALYNPTFVFSNG